VTHTQTILIERSSVNIHCLSKSFFINGLINYESSLDKALHYYKKVSLARKQTLSDIFAQKPHSNGRESSVNKTLDGTIYPG
jgi:hypothetical protein